MHMEKYQIWEEREYTFPNPVKFLPDITAYLHEGEEKRPGIIITPGGGYCCVSCTEGEIVAKTFYKKGYNTFVLTYTTDVLMKIPLRLQPLKDLSRAIAFIRKNAHKFHVAANQIAVCGFSAGGHLSGSLAVHFHEKEILPSGEFQGINNRPDAVILCYPVITAGAFSHKDSFIALLGRNASEDEREYMSVEKHVDTRTPPLFLWHCETDEIVSAENSLLMEKACRKAGVPVELHLFSHGKHGLSVATEEWASGPYTGLYTMRQFFDTLQYQYDHGQEMPFPFEKFDRTEKQDIREIYLQTVRSLRKKDRPDKAVAMWPEMADLWLRYIWRRK